MKFSTVSAIALSDAVHCPSRGSGGIDDAFLWYETQRLGLGHEFLAAADALIAAIAEHPLRYPLIRRNTRRAFMRRFPYAIYFRSYDEVVVVVAFMHGRRNPRRWQVRT